MHTLPDRIFSGYWDGGHVQGIAVDAEKGYIYYSFTTVFVKSDLSGKIIGSVKRLAGHLGCITFNADDGMVYGSLELKHDQIGSGIIKRTGWNPTDEDSFYLVAFDTDKINRLDMDAETDGVMTAVYLNDVVCDYSETDDVSGRKHRYGCSGIDGTGYGPVFGAGKDSDKKIMVAYGIYGEVDRDDNNNQIILQYGGNVMKEYGKPLSQEHPHHSGPQKSEERYFFHTGNTVYGVQNLEYDSFTGDWLAAVYSGRKKTYENFPMFLIDGSVKPVQTLIEGRNGETGKLLSPAYTGQPGKPGLYFDFGQTGVCSLGKGDFYFSQDGESEKDNRYCSTVVKYGFNKDTGCFTEK